MALAAATAIAVGTQAYAAPVGFDNPPGAGHFAWPNTFLDITQDAPSQTGASGAPGQFRQSVGGSYSYMWGTGSDEQVDQSSGYSLCVGLNSGDPIPAGAFPWNSYGYIQNYSGLSVLPEGTATYLSVRFDPGDGFHYGWIGVVRSGLELDTFAWGYETDPGVPIAAGAGLCGDTPNDCDDDTVLDDDDNCPSDPNLDQADFDEDGEGDACDADIDNDGVENDADVCDDTPPGTAVDADGRSKGDMNNDCQLDGSDIQGFVQDYLAGA